MAIRPESKIKVIKRWVRRMGLPILTLSSLVSSPSTALSSSIETLDTRIVDIDGSSQDESVMIFLSAGGRVLRLSSTNPFLAALRAALNGGHPVRVKFLDLGTEDDLIETEILPDLQTDLGSPELRIDVATLQIETREPLLPAERGAIAKQLYEYFESMGLTQESQCFHRAYLWAFEAWKQKGIATDKAFLFFTRKYIRETRYKWWFHVAPFVSDENRRYVLDPTFVPTPMELGAWTSQFVTNGDTCPVIERYFGHGAHHADKSCYVRKVSMYYYHPNTLEKADRNNQVLTGWDLAGLRFSEKARPRAR
jgi:hypothetical protein